MLYSPAAGIDILKAATSDTEEILSLQKAAYRIEAERYNNYDIQPLKQTIDELREQFKDNIILKAVSAGKIVGTVRAYEKNGTCYIGRLAVLPELQNRGIGTALMRKIEKYYEPERYELFVGTMSENNIHLYTRLGYRIFKTASYGCGDIKVHFMEKEG